MTGGASGLGRATAIDLASHGNIVVIGDVTQDAGREAVEQIEAGGGQGAYLPLDVTNRDSVRDFVAQVVARYGRLDCAVNNAGVEGQRTKLADYPDEE